VINLPTTPKLDWVAASQHCGLIKQNIRFLEEKIHSLCHSLPFERVLGIMVVHMVLQIVKFVNRFPQQGGVKHCSPGEIMTDCCLHANDLKLGFRVYCQVTEHVELCSNGKGYNFFGQLRQPVRWTDVPCFGYWTHYYLTPVGCAPYALCHLLPLLESIYLVKLNHLF
jgi:hypothetical protein